MTRVSQAGAALIVALGGVTVVLAFLASQLNAQEGRTAWEVLGHTPFLADSDAFVIVTRSTLPFAAPAPTVPAAGQSPAPMFTYQLDDEPGSRLTFRIGASRETEPGHRRLLYESLPSLLQESLSSTAHLELALLRLTLPPGEHAETRPHFGQGIVYLLGGQIEMSFTANQPRTYVYNAGELFLEPKAWQTLAFMNRSKDAPAKLLVFHLREQTGA
jgi:hypothetical protein